MNIYSRNQQIILGVLIGLSILIRFFSYRTKSPSEGPVLGLLLGISFGMSVFWIWLFANILIDLLKILGLLTGLPTTLLGLTVLAWGNSIGDYMANTSIARKGFVEMALTGCFASPLFNILLGLGLSTLRANLQLGPEGIRFSYKDDHSAIPVCLIVGAIVSLIYTVVMTVFVNKFRISKLQGKLLICIYGAIIGVALYSAA